MSSEVAPANVQWIVWFCHLPGNSFFSIVDKAYIEDSFNLYGLRPHLPGDFTAALCLILDKPVPDLTRAAKKDLTNNAALLYGLIHARFICSMRGLELIRKKYLEGVFGVCPRMMCKETKVLPIGMTETPDVDHVKVYCPSCQDVYSCGVSHRHIDAAFFGPTFPHLFFMTFENLVPVLAIEKFVPRVFGFRVSGSSRSLARPADPCGSGNHMKITRGSSAAVTRDGGQSEEKQKRTAPNAASIPTITTSTLSDGIATPRKEGNGHSVMGDELINEEEGGQDRGGSSGGAHKRKRTLFDEETPAT